jgi:hypothetical protein
MLPAFSPTQLAYYRREHERRALTMRCDVLRGTSVEVGAYTEDGNDEPYLTGIPCTFLRVVPGYRRNEPDRDQVTAEPTLYLTWDADIALNDQITNVRDESGTVLMAGRMEVKTVTDGTFSTTAVLREVTVG